MYELDHSLDTYVRGDLLGPTALRAPELLRSGVIAIRIATSYFDLTDSTDPITYKVCPNEHPTCVDDPRRATFVKLGLAVDTKVGLVDIATAYGFLPWLEADLDLPIVIVDAGASQTFSENPSNPGSIASRTTPDGLDAALKRGTLRLGRLAFNHSDEGFRFNDGTHVGLGRATVGAKIALVHERGIDLALAPVVLLPSPNEAEFAGPASAGVLTRAIFAVPLGEMSRLRGDLGYEYDPDESVLSRLIWDLGVSYLRESFSLDLGFGGSKFNEGIEWTPKEAQAKRDTSSGVPEFATITAVSSTRLGTNIVSFLFGAKMAIAEGWALSGAVSVPLTNDTLEPAAAGTLSLEASF
jgi:hypothetical protein